MRFLRLLRSVTFIVIGLQIICDQSRTVTAQENAQEYTPNDSGIVVADAYLELISASLDKGGKAQEVLSALQQLPLTESSKVPYQIQLARAYVQVGRTKDAESILLQCSHDDPTSVDAVRLLGSYYVQTQKWNDAEKFLSRALSMDPKNWKALAGLGKIYLIRDDDKIRARIHLNEAVRIQPNDENLLFEYAMILFHFDDHLPARIAIQEAEKLNPQIDHKVSMGATVLTRIFFATISSPILISDCNEDIIVQSHPQILSIQSHAII